MKDNERYFRDIKKTFPLNGKREMIYLNHLKEQINEYDNYTYNELVNEFGNPVDIIVSYYKTVDPDYLLQQINIQHYIKIGSFVLVILMIILVLYQIYLLLKVTPL